MIRTSQHLHGVTIRKTTELTTVVCGECGGAYAIAQRFHRYCYEHGTGWNCPYCRTRWGFFGTTEAERKREKRKRAERTLDEVKAELQYTEHRRRGEKAAKTRLQKRAKAGVCPCCSRSFKQLRQHMARMHPAFKPDE